MDIDESNVTIEYTMVEHELLNSIMVATLDCMDTILYGEYHDLPEDSQIRIRYELLDSMKERSFKLWAKRFGIDSCN